MNNTEKNIAKIEDEINALKVAFSQSAVTMPIFTKTVYLQTTKNELNYKYSYQGITYEYNQFASERVMVTFATSRGSNTIATLEINANNNAASPVIQRVNYPGGARWIVTGQPYFPTYPNWAPTEYTFTVHSMVDGTLTAENRES